MARKNRDGNRKSRSELSKRVPDLGYYFIATDTKETERNYLHGLRDSLPLEKRNRIVIKVVETETKGLIAACEQADVDPQYRECWIMFDKDQVAGFDAIIQEAEQKGIRAAWSNPCLEIWFLAYFGSMPSVANSEACCRKFAAAFEKKTGKKYEKSESDIYCQLRQFGDEAKAIQIAENKLKKHKENGQYIPSHMCPCTTVYQLVHEIRKKTM